MGAKDMVGAPTERFQPSPAVRAAGAAAAPIPPAQRRLAAGVGLVALGLPVALLASAPFDCLRDSVSHYYHALWTGDLFVLAMGFIATFLIAYQGENRWEGRLATATGVAAALVALIPTSGAGCGDPGGFAGRAIVRVAPGPDGALAIVEAPLDGRFTLFPGVDWAHFTAGGVLFAFLAFQCLVVFTRVVPARHLGAGGLAPAKRRRDRVYQAAGWTILAVLAVLAARAAAVAAGADDGWWVALNVTLWLEVTALWAFGAAWVVKGRLAGPGTDGP